MLYREFGHTGKKVSILGFGGMRFANVDDHEECAASMLTAAQGGVNYFDTAPGYFETKSELVFGNGFAELKKKNLPFFTATKTFASKEDAIRKEIDSQLKRMGIEYIDFYHIWCIKTLDEWRDRKKNGVLDALKKLKDEGLIRHICVSSHLIGDEIKELLMEGVFEGVLFGYSAYNFRTRQAAFDAVREKNLGVVIMNPLGGGIIPRYPGRFDFIKRPGEGITAAALRFLWDHREISTALAGFENTAQVKDALLAIEGYKPRTAAELAQVKEDNKISLEGICTGCAYCVSGKAGYNCPQGIPIPKYMDAYNHKILSPPGSKDPIGERLYWHWSLERSIAGKCIKCGQCEKACTQHIDIINRLKEIAG